jgi:hypothetical protein
MGLVCLGVLGVNVYGLFYWSWISAIAFGYALLCILIWTVPFFKPRVDGRLTTLGHVSLGISFVAAFVFSILVGGLLAMTFKTAAWIIISLFTLGALFYALGGALRQPTLLLNFLLAGMLALAVQTLPPPPGSLDDEKDFPDRTKIVVEVVTDKGDVVLAKVEVYVNWRKEGEPESEDNKEYAGRTDEGKPVGTVVYKTWKDPTGKVAVITSKDTERSWLGYYADGRLEVHDISKGETRQVELKMPFRSTR